MTASRFAAAAAGALLVAFLGSPTVADVISEWSTAVVPPPPELKEVTLQFQDQSRSVLQTWTFADAFPVRWTGPSFAADSSSIAVESLEIAHAGMAGI